MKDIYKEIYHYYTDYLLKKGKPPNYTEIAEHCNMTKQAIHQHIQRMEKAGYIFKLKKSAIFWCFNVEKYN